MNILFRKVKNCNGNCICTRPDRARECPKVREGQCLMLELKEMEEAVGEFLNLVECIIAANEK